MNLIINLGLKSIRGIVLDDAGEQIYSKAYPVHTSLFKERVEQDAGEWLDLLEKILSGIAVNTDLSEQIEYITATTSSSCIVGINDRFLPETKVLMVSDKRAVKEAEEIKQKQEFRSKEKEYGLVCPASSLVPKALWFKKNEPELFSEVIYWLGAGELINFFFTGEIFTDSLNATKAFYNGTSYESDLLKNCGINVSTLPPVKEIGTIFEIKPDLKKKYNLSSACKFVLTTYDAICAVIGSGNGEAFNACDVSGTVTSVRVLSDIFLKGENSCLLVQPLNFLNKYMVGASNNLGGGIIEWYKQAFYNADTTNVYFQMENEAQLSSVGSGGIVFLPFLLGERAPFIAPNASGNFFGINRSSTIKDFTRAVFESTAYVTRDLTELIESSGISVNSISVSGGLARFDTINMIKADVSNKPVHVIDNFESTSIGAYILLALANKTYSSLDEAVKRVVRVRKVIYPSDKRHKLYEQYFQLYKELNNKLMPMYDNHKQILSERNTHENEIVRNL